MTTPYVGILVNSKLYEGLKKHDTKREHIEFYEEAMKPWGIHICYFRLTDVDRQLCQVLAYVKPQDHFIQTWLPMPRVVHNRAIHLDHHAFLELERWRQQGIHIFNQWNRYNKWYIHNILMKEKSLHRYLPVTYRATVNRIFMMRNKFPSIIIKPNKSSIGRGIMKLDRLSSKSCCLTYPKTLKLSNRVWKKIYFRNQLPQVLCRRIQKSPYIVQQRIPLATCEGQPFDLRVSVQRGGTGQWGITGVVAKVATKNHFLTNIGQGGRVFTMDEIFKFNQRLVKKQVMEDVHECALKVVAHLSLELPHLADLGLDIGICADGSPMFIECNGKDQRYSFRRAGLLREWKATYETPMAYAKYLLDQHQGLT